MVIGLWIACGVLVVGLVWAVVKIVKNEDISVSLGIYKRDAERLHDTLSKIEEERNSGKKNGFRIGFKVEGCDFMEETIIADSCSEQSFNYYDETEYVRFYDAFGKEVYSIEKNIVKVIERVSIDTTDSEQFVLHLK